MRTVRVYDPFPQCMKDGKCVKFQDTIFPPMKTILLP